MPASAYLNELHAAMGGRLVIVPGVDAIIRDTNGNVLIARRSDDGTWDLPGGAVDPGETPAEAIHREVREETGLEVRILGVAGVFGGREFRYRYANGQAIEGFAVAFDCEVIGGRLRSADGEATEFRFVSPDAMPRLTMPYPPAMFRRDRTETVFV